MTLKLSRERVLKEISSLDRDIEDLVRHIGAAREGLSVELQDDLRELENSIIWARQFTTSNEMDFRRVEAALTQLRALKAKIYNALDGCRTNAQY